MTTSAAIDQLSIWPVPAGTSVVVRSPHPQNVVAELLSTTGRVVQLSTLAFGINTLDVSTLDAGIYLFRTREGSAVRLVKE